ncbi:MAG: PCMD domain-containing protein [Sphingobacteriales bacterium JAD_PAG50586_3]|nr:MAG: PCMD domain-containing protein [Sphingobacteriales bacterium JAD_PAG50586_3]
MKKISLIALSIILIVIQLQAQPIVNGNLEDWQQSQSGLYDQPTGGFWATLNALRDLGGPVTVEKTTDACQGEFAAKLTTKSFTSLLVAGFLASGTFNQLNLTNPLTIGKPFTLKPQSLSGCYKYVPVNNDSAALVSILTKWNSQTNSRDTIASAGGITAQPQPNYTTFNYTYEYFSQETPDSIQVVFTSSADGANNNGQVGSALWVDNISLEIINGIDLPMMPEVMVNCYPNPVTNFVTINLENIPGSSAIAIYSANGIQLLQKKALQGLNTVDFTSLPCGNYIYTITQNNQTLYWGSIAHN